MKQELHLSVMYNGSRDGEAGSCFLSARRAAPAVLVQGPVAASVSLSRGINTAAFSTTLFSARLRSFWLQQLARVSWLLALLACSDFTCCFPLCSTINTKFQPASQHCPNFDASNCSNFSSGVNLDSGISYHLPVGVSAFEVGLWCFSLKFPYSTTAADRPSLTSRHPTGCASKTSTSFFCRQS